jgi:hypothetical protein
MNFNANSLKFKPFVPEKLKGTQTLNNFKYRDAILDISMKGHGNKIRTISMDGKPLENATVPGNLEGKHTIVILLEDNELSESKTNLVGSYFSPATPVVSYDRKSLKWEAVKGAVKYQVLRNGREETAVTQTNFKVIAGPYAEYQVIAIDSLGVPSFASEPVETGKDQAAKIIEMETILPKEKLPYKGFTGQGFVEISKQKNTMISINLVIPEAGTYAIDFRYANGNGPTNTENKCAIRTLMNGQDIAGTFVFPQRGKGEWSDWGYSNPVQMKLEKGKINLKLVFSRANENMNGEINQALLDHLRLIKLD